MKNLKKLGFVKVSAIIALSFIIGLTVMMLPQVVKASTYDSHALSIPDKSSYGITDLDNVYLIFYDIDTLYMANKTTGTPAIDTTWANAAVPCAKIGTNVFATACTVPALDQNIRWAVIGFENGTPANTDAIKIPAVRYDPHDDSRCTFTDTVKTIFTRGMVHTAP